MSFAVNRSGLQQQSQPPVLPGFGHVNRYYDRVNHQWAAKILPGEYYVTTGDELIVTVLGSCVSACVRDPVFGIGGMNHFMLPSEAVRGDKAVVSASARYGNVAMEHLINTILHNGGRRDALEVKIFGGGRILAQMTDIGRRNIEFVRKYIATEGLTLLAQDVGDIYPRKVVYHPPSGRVRLKKLLSLHNNTIMDRETKYLRQLETEPVEGEIDLF